MTQKLIKCPVAGASGANLRGSPQPDVNPAPGVEPRVSHVPSGRGIHYTMRGVAASSYQKMCVTCPTFFSPVPVLFLKPPSRITHPGSIIFGHIFEHQEGLVNVLIKCLLYQCHTYGGQVAS